MTPPGSTSAREPVAPRLGAPVEAAALATSRSGLRMEAALPVIGALALASLGLGVFGFEALLEFFVDHGRVMIPSQLMPFFLLSSVLIASVLVSLWAGFSDSARFARWLSLWMGVFGLIGTAAGLSGFSGSREMFAALAGMGLLGTCLLTLWAGRVARSQAPAVDRAGRDPLFLSRLSLVLCFSSLGAVWIIGNAAVTRSTEPFEEAVQLPVGGTLQKISGPWSNARGAGRSTDSRTDSLRSASSSASGFWVADDGALVERFDGGGMRVVQPASRNLGPASAVVIASSGRGYASALVGGQIVQLRGDGSAVPVAEVSSRFGEVVGLSETASGLLVATTDQNYGFGIELPATDAGMLHFPESAVHRALVGSVTESSASLGWVTATPHRGSVSIWTDGESVQRVVEPAAVHEHGLTLIDLEPDRIHHFTIETPSGASHVQQFRTLPAPSVAPQFTMAVVADPQFDGAASRRGQHFARAVEAINASDVDFVVIAGDLVDHRNREGVLSDFMGTPDDSRRLFREFRQIASKLKVPWYVAAGNHEHLARPGVRSIFLEEFGLERAYYGLDLGGARFLFLEGVEEQGWKPDPAQLSWLKSELETHAGRDVFVVTHYAVVDDPFVFDRDRGRMPQVQALLESHGRVRAVYNGHKNLISATSQNGILYVTTPSPSIAPHGYYRVRVYKEGLLQNFVSTPGTPLRLGGPRMQAAMAPNPEVLRHDSLYRWGRPEARNFAWSFPLEATSTEDVQ